MQTMIELSQAGIDYPEMRLLHNLVERLRAQRDVKVGVYGGFLRDLLLLGKVCEQSDIDLAMWIPDFLGLKPITAELDDVRRDFELHPPHLLFMLHQLADGVFEANERPVVLRLRQDAWHKWGVARSVGLSLTREPLDLMQLVDDADLGFAQVVSNGQQIWVSEAFLRDRQQQTMTLLRCASVRDFERTTTRVQRFQATRYVGWKFVIPPTFGDLQQAAE